MAIPADLDWQYPDMLSKEGLISILQQVSYLLEKEMNICIYFRNHLVSQSVETNLWPMGIVTGRQLLGYGYICTSRQFEIGLGRR